MTPNQVKTLIRQVIPTDIETNITALQIILTGPRMDMADIKVRTITGEWFAGFLKVEP
jgi:hypothetical protein